MDTSTDGVVQQAPASPTRSLQQAFEMATPRARRSSTILAPQRPSTDQSGLPPLEPPSPSPAPRTGSDQARQCSTILHPVGGRGVPPPVAANISAIPTGILAVESCLPPVPLLISQRQRIAAIRVICFPPEVNPSTARLHPSFPSLSRHRVQDSSRALTKGLTSVYSPLHWKAPQPVPPIRNHIPIDAVAHKSIPFTHGLCRIPMINSHLVSPALAVPSQSLMNSHTYSALKKRVREALLKELFLLFPTPGYYHHRPTLNRGPFM